MDIKFCVKHRGVVKDETAAEIEDFCKLCPRKKGRYTSLKMRSKGRCSANVTSGRDS